MILPSGAPMISPPVRLRRRFPDRACSSAHPWYARCTSGTYSGCSKYVSRMMRDLPCDEPNA